MLINKSAIFTCDKLEDSFIIYEQSLFKLISIIKWGEIYWIKSYFNGNYDINYIQNQIE